MILLPSFSKLRFKPAVLSEPFTLSGEKTLVFLHRLIVQILPVHHEENLVDKRRFRRQTRRLKAGQRFAAARGMPNIAAAFRYAQFFACAELLIFHKMRSAAAIWYYRIISSVSFASNTL